MVRAINDGSQLATAEKLNDYWIAETHPNGTRYHGDTAKDALLLALGIAKQYKFESVDFVATVYTNGMISYKDKE